MIPASNVEPPIFFLKETKYHGNHPAFYDPHDFPWVRVLEANYQVIVEEIAGLIYGREEIPTNLNPPYLSDPKAWRNLYFFNFRWFTHSTCHKYPRTFALLNTIPNISFAGITVLEPHGRVLPHTGETNTIIRCHLGLMVPGNGIDCALKVDDQIKPQETGKVLMFSDAHLHETWNNTDDRRFVLVFDVIHPDYVKHSNWVCARSLAALTIKYVDEHIKIIQPWPNIILQALLHILAAGWYCYLPIQKRLGVFSKNS